MKTIGLLGGMSWESTVSYYQIVNQEVKERLGGLHSAKVIVNSVDFAEVTVLQRAGDWDGASKLLCSAATQLKDAGADMILICTNTMHIVAPDIERKVNIPLIHIVDATAEALKAKGIKTVGLLGTAFTMEKEFYKGRLEEKHGIKVIVPGEEDRKEVHRVIFDELCLGSIKPESKERYLDIMEQLVRDGAEGVILGCTEIGLLVKQQDTDITLFDTTRIHATCAVNAALKN